VAPRRRLCRRAAPREAGGGGYSGAGRTQFLLTVFALSPPLPLSKRAGTARGSAAGFRLDALLRLGDVKAADRRTSLLQFVLTSALGARPGLAALPAQLATVVRAANVQPAAVAALMEELSSAARRAREERALLAADAEAAAAAATAASGAAAPPSSPGAAAAAAPPAGAVLDAAALDARLAAFEAAAAARLAQLHAQRAAVDDALTSLAAYFGEAFSAREPTRVLTVVRDFLPVFEKALAAAASAAAAAAPPPAHAGGRRPAAPAPRSD